LDQRWKISLASRDLERTKVKSAQQQLLILAHWLSRLESKVSIFFFFSEPSIRTSIETSQSRGQKKGNPSFDDPLWLQSRQMLAKSTLLAKTIFREARKIIM
jgi:hypothetical protein